MKKPFRRIAPLVLPVLAAAFLSSCVETGYPDGGRYTTTSGYGVYTAVPTNYAGNTYYYNGRYYAGGRYQSGRYNYHGRVYDNRYYYNGQYFYGGRYQQHAGNAPRYGPRYEQDRAGYRETAGPPRDDERSRYQSPTVYVPSRPLRTSFNPYR